jgi:glyoxylase-like metal-dependent hydrolase (beta-lactamase superfamily II)
MPLPPRPAAQPSGVRHLAVGDLVVSAINDGAFTGSLDLVTNIDGPEAEELQRRAFRPVPPPLTVNAFLIRRPDDTLILVDTGCAGTMGPTLGNLPAHLSAMGIDPAAIGTVLLTHMHPDHANGLIDAAGAAAFPQAELIVPSDELAFWNRDDLPEAMGDFVKGARAAIAPYRARTRPITAGEVLPGVTAVAEPGHTPGHTGWLLDGGGDALLIWGDIVHLPGIQFANPEAGVAFDVDGAQAVTTRKRIMDMVATDGLRVAGMHLEFPGFGHLTRAAGGYTYLPELWTPTL